MLKGQDHKIISNLHCLHGVNSGVESCCYQLTLDACRGGENSLKERFLEMVCWKIKSLTICLILWIDVSLLIEKKTFSNTFQITLNLLFWHRKCLRKAAYDLADFINNVFSELVNNFIGFFLHRIALNYFNFFWKTISTHPYCVRFIEKNIDLMRPFKTEWKA